MRQIVISDRVYGKVRISEPVILELINSPEIQRLKEIDQGGYRPLFVKPNTKIRRYEHSRFAHSIGVYLLLNRYNAPLVEQIAGLIHDVSHAAFSHCIDYVLDIGSEKTHAHQDNIFEDFVKKSKIPPLIQKYGYDLEYILDDKNFPLKEKKLPDLCADRIDYSLRTAVIFGELNRVEVESFLVNLTVENGNWVFKNFESAKKYAELFLKLNKIYYAGFQSAIMFRAVGDCLLYALQKNYITENDLYTTDKTVLMKIKKYYHIDQKLNLLFKRMNNKIGYENNPNNYDAQVFCKSRIVDPWCKYNNKLKRVSEIDINWCKTVKQESEPKQYFIKFDK